MDYTPFEAPTVEALNELLPAYEVTAFVAQGGMGAVYKAHQYSLARDVALKILPRELGADEAFRQSFETEARAMARLNHPNIIGVHDFGEVDGLLYIAMEMVPGKSLYHSAHRTAIDPDQATDIIHGICLGLQHAHEQGVIHRDVKPANILLTPKREPKIGDFGLARPEDVDAEFLAMGTPDYMAPETMADADCRDARADVYAVGVIFHELLTGALPAEGCPPPSEVAGCDPGLDAICLKATQQDPAIRYQSAEEMANDLKQWKESRAQAISAPITEPVNAQVAGYGQSHASSKTGANPSLIRNLVIIVILLIAIAFTWKIYQIRLADRDAIRMADAPTREDPKPQPVASKMVKPDVKPAGEKEPVIPAIQDDSGIKERRVVSELSPEEKASLAELTHLKADLAEGRYERLPKGTVTHESGHYFLVPTAMTWSRAQEFSKMYGAELAVPSSNDDLTWLASHMAALDRGKSSEDSLWISAYLYPRGEWKLANGEKWPFAKLPAGDGKFVSMDASGKFHSNRDELKRAFLMVWSDVKGDRTSDLLEKLAAIKKSVDAGSPDFPDDAIRFGKSHYLIVDQDCKLADALKFAAASGGSLVALSTPEEADWMARQLANKHPSSAYWMGCERRDPAREWFWTSGEPWTCGRWDKTQKLERLLYAAITPSTGWKSLHRMNTIQGFIIEWNHGRPVQPKVWDGVGPLRAEAQKLLLDLHLGRKLAMRANAKKLTDDLNTWIRLSTKGEAQQNRGIVNLIKTRIVDGRIPIGLPKRATERCPQKLLDFTGHHIGKQEGFDSDFDTDAELIRDFYVKRLRMQMTEQQERGQPGLVDNLNHAIQQTEDLKRWLATFKGIDKGPIPRLIFIKVLHARYGTEDSNANVTKRVSREMEVLMRDFRVDRRFLRVNPAPGLKKKLTIYYKLNGETFRKSWDENSKVRRSELEDGIKIRAP